MVSIVSKKYSEALYLVGAEKNALEKYQNEILDLKEVFFRNKEIMQSLCHPQLPLQAKNAIVQDLFDEKVSREVVALLYVVLRKSRQEFLPEIFDAFIERCKINNNISTAVVISAEKLNDDYIKKIKNELENKIAKTIEIEERIDDRLIGGMKVMVDNKLFDGSIDGKIKNIYKAIC
ncbi:MAG: ATP synthase F1 subunit delta [Clostridia bacterium]|nr:ATP synthase F1 subunit delta [Clostridia bacterium]